MARGQTRDNGAGTLVDTIMYESTGVTLTDNAAAAIADDAEAQEGIAVGKVKIPVEVRLRKTFVDGGGTNRAVNQLEFSLVCRKPSIKLAGTDIEALRRAMWAELDKDSAIAWEPHLLITIEPARGWGDGIGEGLTLNEKTVYKGTTRDGYMILREHRHSSMGIGDLYRPWPGAFTDQRGKVTACIPANDKNRDAMDEFRGRIVELRKMLQQLVKPETIQQTLANLSGIALLAAPQPTTETIREGEEA